MARYSPEITIQADIGGCQVAIVEMVGAESAADIDARLDVYRKAIERQRAHNSLIEALVDLTARCEALAMLPEREREWARTRAAERARLAASFDAAAQTRRSGSRSLQEKQALEKFDEQTPIDQGKFAVEREKLMKEIPMYEAQVARQRAIIAGRDRSEVMGVALERSEDMPGAQEAAD